MRQRQRLFWVGLGSIALIALAVPLANQWTLIKYRFFILSPGENAVQNLNLLVRCGIDAVFMTAYSATGIFDTKPSIGDLGIDTLHLRVEPGSLEQMASRLPESAKARFYGARLLYPDSTWKNIRYRFRGRNIWHWLPEKPSLRLKLSRNDPINLQRSINLVNPEDRAAVSNVLGDILARELGVLTPETDFVGVFINGEYRGVYHMTTNEDEEILRIRKRIPGPLFIGSRLAKKWVASEFETAGNLDVLSSIQPLEQMVHAISMPPTRERYEALWNVLSLEKTAAWLAALNLAGGVHTDYHHNHLYYFDPALGQLEPVTSDINGHGLLDRPEGMARLDLGRRAYSTSPINEILHPLDDVALRDPRFYHRRNEILWRAVNGIGSTESQGQILRGIFTTIDRAMRSCEMSWRNAASS